MNWIKITPETELPPYDTDMLVIYNGEVERGTLLQVYKRRPLFENNDGVVFDYSDVTHYCIITPPTPPDERPTVLFGRWLLNSVEARNMLNCGASMEQVEEYWINNVYGK